ncbi:MAG: hypothetical protein A2Z34_11350 [Planctomycetes bacterium RBG_16_59_8]|nr:MAG: hypothetical protein A2Z34_11350 [Planctomycetes bacterium RBG_16_59_8]
MNAMARTPPFFQKSTAMWPAMEALPPLPIRKTFPPFRLRFSINDATRSMATRGGEEVRFFLVATTEQKRLRISAK